VGATTCLTCERGEYAPTAEIIAEIDAYCQQEERVAALDFVTITASGEPTLHIAFGKIIAHVKQAIAKPIAVLTNGTLLSDPQVCQELALADVVIPSLDSALPSGFRKIDRPDRCLDLEKIIQGLIRFSQQYRGKIWLEILLAQGINDSEEEIEALCRVVGQMRLDRIQLNTVARPPLEDFARPLAQHRLEIIAARFQKYNPSLPVDLLAQGTMEENEQGEAQKIDLDRDVDREALLVEVMEMLKRRPCTVADINRTFHLGGTGKVEQLLETLVRDGLVHKRVHNDRSYYLPDADRRA
ncbi:MAG: radical SAM protein, partial [Candidatus Electrothrix sp. AR3]|nr:radical SAM protein [Candidatus Electrothrix sp. AR3]